MGISYELVKDAAWPALKTRLVDEHPLTRVEIIELCREVFKDILLTRIGSQDLRYITDIKLQGDTFGVLFETLLLRRLTDKYPGVWRKGGQQDELDVVCIPQPGFSFEVKTTSKRIVYGPKSVKLDPHEQNHGSYHLLVFWDLVPYPSIGCIKWGWCDPCDYRSSASTYSRPLRKEILDLKFETLWRREDIPDVELARVLDGMGQLPRELNQLF